MTENVFPFADSQDVEESTPDEIRAKLKHDISFDLNSVIREVLSAIQDRDCSRPDVFKRVRHEILDKLNNYGRQIITYIDGYEIVTRNRQQLVFPMNQAGGIIMADGEE